MLTRDSHRADAALHALPGRASPSSRAAYAVYAAGQTFTLRNDGGAPLGNADPANPNPATNGRVMQFRVNKPLSSHAVARA